MRRLLVVSVLALLVAGACASNVCQCYCCNEQHCPKPFEAQETLSNCDDCIPTWCIDTYPKDCTVSEIWVLSKCLIKDEPFEQEVATRKAYEGAPIADWATLPLRGPVRATTQTHGNASVHFLLTDDALYQYNVLADTMERVDTRYKLPVTPHMRVAAWHTPEFGFTLAVAGPPGVWFCSTVGGTPGCANMGITLGDVHAVTALNSTVWFGVDTGLVSWHVPYLGAEGGAPPSTPHARLALAKPVHVLRAKEDGGLNPVRALAMDAQRGILYAGQDNRLVAVPVASLGGAGGHARVHETTPRLEQQYSWFVSRGAQQLGGAVCGPVRALATDARGRVWIGSDTCVNVLAPDMTMHRIDGTNGLPMGNVSSIAVSDDGDDVWFGTDAGLVRVHVAAGACLSELSAANFTYYRGQRWLPGDRVSSVAVTGKVAVACTDAGVSRVVLAEQRLGDKVAYWQDLVYPMHDRHGLVGQGTLAKYGQRATFVQVPSDNDGLWTSIYLAAMAYRFGVTGDAIHQMEALGHFEAMESLVAVTGIAGYPARSFVVAPEKPSKDGVWFASTVKGFEQYTWKGNTSSDEVTGHMFVYPLVHDLVATDSATKARARALVLSIARHIVQHGYYLVGHDGKPTRWGVWAPEQLNHDPAWMDGRGLNSLQIVSWLVSAYRLSCEDTCDAKLLAALHDLAVTHQYMRNLVNAKVEFPLDVNYSDDTLTFLAYATYFHAYREMTPAQRAQLPAGLHGAMEASVKRTMRFVWREQYPLWHIVYAAAMGPFTQLDFGVAASLDTLRQWPLEHITWPTRNSDRLDVVRNPLVAGESTNVLKYSGKDVFRYSDNPFQLDKGDGMVEMEPSAPLLAYWMAIHHHMLDPSQ